MKTQNKNKKNNNKGGTLVEALISMAILSFVFVSILSGFSFQQMDTKRNTDKNMAIMLAEMRMEELMKFPSTQLIEETFVDYFVPKPNGYEYYGEDAAIPNELKQFRRTATITREDILQQLATIRVLVEYGAMKGKGGLIYPYRIELTTRRSLK
ncbi:MAG: prepilin-type N-terminal cleavage/methylation domain-containing protein [Candidatus Aminicenantes bacterium]|nr:MAG: prepilin-type N-terminal cleavage/methylation domain-containing protein [Candidatus Aminicenantes bacterium]